MTAVQKVHFQIFMRFRICEGNFLKFSAEKALSLPISEIQLSIELAKCPNSGKKRSKIWMKIEETTILSYVAPCFLQIILGRRSGPFSSLSNFI